MDVKSGSVSKRGLRDWQMQRITAVLALLYFMVVGVLLFSGFSVVRWRELFSQFWMQSLTIVALLVVFWHAWIGLWTVLTDYVHNKAIRLCLESLIAAVMLGYVVWLVRIFWF
jgi:succinate dehydrogenase / fumarate reductase, membrane anchor subunit